MTFEQIERLYNCGFAIIPIKSANKKPYLYHWKRYQIKRPTLEQLKIWYEKYPDMNAGIIVKTSNLIVLDVESKEALSEIEKYGSLPKTVTVKSGRFRHYYFRRGDILPPHMLKFIPEADMIASTYVASVGSLHASGKEYEWLLSPDDCELPECPQWLINLVKEKRVELQALRKQRKRENQASTSEMQVLESIKNFKKHTVPNSEELTIQQRFKRSIRYLVKRRPEINIQAGIDLSNSKETNISVNNFNRRFRDRNRPIPYILWDKKNELFKNNGKDFYITYGIVLEKSKNKLRQLGELIVYTFKKNGLQVQCNDLLSGRIRIQNLS